MPNMSYCRFHNTLNDLRDCLEAIADVEGPDPLAELSESEAKAARKLIKLCREIAEDYEDIEEKT